MLQKEFLSGLEETFARFISFFINLSFFAIFSLTKNENWKIDNFTILLILCIFWFSYELISYILFVIFKFFSNKETNSKEL